MNSPEPVIIFVDNSVSRIYKTVEALKLHYGNVIIYSNEQELLDSLPNQIPDVVLMNLDLFPNDAVLLSREIRKIYQTSPPFLIIYSDKQDDFVQELAYNSGVDSFINFQTKPAIINVFLKSLLKRRVLHADKKLDKVVIDTDRYLIYKFGEPLQLPRKEFKLFELLYNNSERFFSKPEIAEAIWHDTTVAKKRAIDVHIYNIRQLFGKRIIQSQKGKGYRMNKKILG
jgi:DNA-binding response OmpR family regulator